MRVLLGQDETAISADLPNSFRLLPETVRGEILPEDLLGNINLGDPSLERGANQLYSNCWYQEDQERRQDNGRHDQSDTEPSCHPLSSV